MTAADLIYRMFLFTTGNRIQHCHKTSNPALCQDHLDIVVVFLRRDERKKFGLVVLLILFNDRQSRCIQGHSHCPCIICNSLGCDILYRTINDIRLLQSQETPTLHPMQQWKMNTSRCLSYSGVEDRSVLNIFCISSLVR